MIKRNNSFKSGVVSANVGLDPSAISTANNNINNNIYIKTPYPNVTLQPSDFNERDIKLDEVENASSAPAPAQFEVTTTTFTNEPPKAKEDDVKTLILETFAQILLTQDKALIANLITRKSIIIPYDALQRIIQLLIKSDVEIDFEEDVDCCVSKASPIRRINHIKVIKDDGEVVTDFKTVYNKEWNELVNKYHLCLKFVLI